MRLILTRCFASWRCVSPLPLGSIGHQDRTESCGRWRGCYLVLPAESDVLQDKDNASVKEVSHGGFDPF